MAEYDNKETFNAWFAMSIKGKDVEFERKKAIKSIDIDEVVDGFDTCTISIEDPDLLYISDDLYVEDTPMSIDLGFHNGTPYKVNFYGYIASIDIDFSEEGIPTVELYCVDKSHLMNRVKNSRTWENCTNADLVKYFANEYGFKYYIEDYPYKTEESISQSNQTDIEFLQSRAKNEIQPFVCKLIGDTLYYIKKGLLSTPVRSLCYKKYPFEIRGFKPQINRETKEMEVQYADMTTDKTIDTGLANNINTSREVQGYPVSTTDVPFGSVAYRESTNTGSTSTSKSQEEATKQMIEIEMRTLTGEVTLRTFPNLLMFQTFQTVILDGLGKYLSGMYFISGVRRTLNSEGFSQTLSVLKNGFGDSLKLPDSELVLQAPEDTPLQLSAEKPIEVGTTVRVCDWTAKWGKDEEGVIVPAWVKTEVMTVAEMDGEMCLLMPINKWIHISYLVYEKVSPYEVLSTWTEVTQTSSSSSGGSSSSSGNGSANAFVEVALGEVGTGENGTNNCIYNTWFYGHEVSGSSYPWCAVFVSWCADKAGVNLIKTASAGAFADAGTFHSKGSGYSPKKGDLFLVNYSNGYADHVGIVAEDAPGNGYFNTVEGNHGDMVARDTRAVSACSFVTPNF